MILVWAVFLDGLKPRITCSSPVWSTSLKLKKSEKSLPVWPVFGPILEDITTFFSQQASKSDTAKKTLEQWKDSLCWVSLGVLLPLFVGIVVSIHYGHHWHCCKQPGFHGSWHVLCFFHLSRVKERFMKHQRTVHKAFDTVLILWKNIFHQLPNHDPNLPPKDAWTFQFCQSFWVWIFSSKYASKKPLFKGALNETHFGGNQTRSKSMVILRVHSLK